METLGKKLERRFGWKWKMLDHITSLMMCAAFIYLSFQISTYYAELADKCPCYFGPTINESLIVVPTTNTTVNNTIMNQTEMR